MIRKLITTALLMGSFIVCMAMVLDVTGKWTGLLNIPDGSTLNLTYNFKSDGDKLTGTAASQEGETAIENGKIKGSEITFTVKRNGADVPHVGTVYPDSIGMNIQAEGYKFHVQLKKTE